MECPAILATATTKLVFPTPGAPSNKIGLGNWSPRSRWMQFLFVVVVLKLYCSSGQSVPSSPDNNKERRVMINVTEKILWFPVSSIDRSNKIPIFRKNYETCFKQ